MHTYKNNNLKDPTMLIKACKVGVNPGYSTKEKAHQLCGIGKTWL